MSLNKTVLWAATVVMSFAAGYYLAFTNVTRPISANTNLTNELPVSNNSQTPTSLILAADNTQPNALPVAPDANAGIVQDLVGADIDVNDMIVMLKNELHNEEGETSDYAQLAKAWSLISTLDQGQLFAALSMLQADFDNLENRELVGMLLNEYARYAPNEAISLVEQSVNELGKKSFYVRKVLAQWSKQDAHAAFNWYEQNQASYQRFSSGFVNDVFKGLAANDIYDAIDKLNDLSSDRLTTRRAISGITANMGGSSADFAALLEHARLQNNEQTNRAIVAEWSKNDPYAAIEWLDSQTLNDELMQQTVLNNWMYSAGENTSAAADWYLQQSQSDNYDKRLNTVMQSFARTNPDAGLYWLNQTALADKQNALVNLISSTAGINQDFAIKHIPMIENEAEKLKISMRVYRSLNYNNPQKAQQFADSSPFKQQLLKTNQSSRSG